MRIVLSASVALSLALLAGRLTGLLRELELAALFGISSQADAAVLLLAIPDLLVNLLLSGGLSAALVPHFNTLARPQAVALFRQASIIVALFFGAAGALLVAWPQGLFYLIAPGMRWQILGGTAGLLAVAMAIPLTGMAGVAGAYLNASQRFFVTGCGTLIFNTVVLVALLCARGHADPLLLLACGIAGGAAFRWGAQLLALDRSVWRAAPPAPPIDRALVCAFGSAALAAALMLLAPILVRAMASTIGPGAIASFNYAQKLMELPVAILITSISTVALSRLSVLHANKMAAAAATAVSRDTQYALLLAVAVTLLGVWFSDSVVHVLFSRGKMDAVALGQVSALTRVALLSVPLIAISSMAVADLNASKKTHLVLKITFFCVLTLPLLAWPGLANSSALGLMAAVVAFQAVVAIALGRASTLRLLGENGLFACWPYLIAVAIIAALVVVADLVLHPSLHWLRLLFPLCGLAAVVLLPVRHFLRSHSTLQQLPTAV